MANARVVRGLSKNSAFGRQVEQITARTTAKKFESVARAAESAFDDIVGAEFVNDRPPDRRRNGRHLLGSSNARVIWDGQGFPVKISLGSTAEGKKLGALNYGAQPHIIPGPVVFPVANRWGATKIPMRAPTAGRFQVAYSHNAPGSPTVKAPFVNHPGNAPHYMLERALEQAVNAAYSGAIRLARK